MGTDREPIAVIGTGYVGLVTAAGFAQLGSDVWCVDVDAEKIATLNRGQVPIYEPGLEECVARNRGRLHFSSELSPALEHARLLFVAVGALLVLLRPSLTTWGFFLYCIGASPGNDAKPRGPAAERGGGLAGAKVHHGAGGERGGGPEQPGPLDGHHHLGGPGCRRVDGADLGRSAARCPVPSADAATVRAVAVPPRWACAVPDKRHTATPASSAIASASRSTRPGRRICLITPTLRAKAGSHHIEIVADNPARIRAVATPDRLTGLDASFRLIAAQALRAQATTSVLLLGVAPFFAAYALACATGLFDGSALPAGAVAAPFLAGLSGLRALYRGFCDLAGALHLAATELRRNGVFELAHRLDGMTEWLEELLIEDDQ